MLTQIDGHWKSKEIYEIKLGNLDSRIYKFLVKGNYKVQIPSRILKRIKDISLTVVQNLQTIES